MQCSCNASGSYDEVDNQFYGVKERKARKEHKCYECGSTIKPFENYFFHTLFCEGTIRNYKTCENCQNIIWHFFQDGWIFGSIWETLNDYIYENWRDDLPSSCICQLPPVARDKVCDMIEEIHQDLEKG